jgi:hypothetical protein
MRLRNHKDFWSGLMFLGLGILFMALSRQYQMGTAAKMGPGYFPMVLGGILAVLGLIITVGAFARSNDEKKVGKIGWRENILVLVSVGLFAFLLPRLGMVVSLLVLIFAGAMASHEFRLKATAVSSIFLVVLAWVVFGWGLELQMPIWPPFLTK